MMKDSFEAKLRKMVEEERQAEVDFPLLNQLRELVAEDDGLLEKLPKEKRNSLNTFFNEVRELVISEMAANKFGSSIILDSIIVTMFEVGLKTATRGLFKK
jgi:hypothetical protein